MKKLLFLFFICSHTLWAQNHETKNFQQILAQASLQYNAPLENSYKVIPIESNNIHNYTYAIKSKSKDLEIRYSIKKFQQTDLHTNHIPHLKCLALANTIADNTQDFAIAVHDISAKNLSKYNADWGAIVYFRPKTQFSTKIHCKMLALFAEDKADVYIFYLFNEASKELDHQLYNIRFEKD